MLIIKQERVPFPERPEMERKFREWVDYIWGRSREKQKKAAPTTVEGRGRVGVIDKDK